MHVNCFVNWPCWCMLQKLNAADLSDVGFKPEWNSDPQLMGLYFVLFAIQNTLLTSVVSHGKFLSNVFCLCFVQTGYCQWMVTSWRWYANTAVVCWMLNICSFFDILCLTNTWSMLQQCWPPFHFQWPLTKQPIRLYSYHKMMRWLLMLKLTRLILLMMSQLMLTFSILMMTCYLLQTVL